jgi:hypothetical protein
MSKNNSSSAGVGIACIVFIIFLVLKLAGVGVVATWSWWWIFAPLWMPTAIVFLVFVLVVIIKAVAWKRKLR